MHKVVLKYGLIAGSIMVTLFAISALLVMENPENYTITEVIGFASIILCLMAIFFGIQWLTALK